jgi:hypothetical protein
VLCGLGEVVESPPTSAASAAAVPDVDETTEWYFRGGSLKLPEVFAQAPPSLEGLRFMMQFMYADQISQRRHVNNKINELMMMCEETQKHLQRVAQLLLGRDEVRATAAAALCQAGSSSTRTRSRSRSRGY